jgi:hypothetical protein
MMREIVIDGGFFWPLFSGKKYSTFLQIKKMGACFIEAVKKMNKFQEPGGF